MTTTPTPSSLKQLLALLIGIFSLALWTPATTAAEFSVKNVQPGDVLSVRKWPGVKSKIIAQIPPEGTGIIDLGKRAKKGRSIWAKVKWGTQTGWINTRYLTRSKATGKQPSGTTTRQANAHTHPANRCTRSITHSHPNGKRKHTHRYSCQGNATRNTPKTGKKADANAHRHPANRCTRSITHSHPNGKRSHTHRYSCQGKRKTADSNKHRHPANRCTRSILHSHPNGKRKHSHRYSCRR